MDEALSPTASDLDDRREVTALFENLKSALPQLETLLEECSGHWVYEDYVYRFYHQSFKVHELQSRTLKIVQKLHALAPDRQLNSWFM